MNWETLRVECRYCIYRMQSGVCKLMSEWVIEGEGYVLVPDDHMCIQFARRPTEKELAEAGH